MPVYIRKRLLGFLGVLLGVSLLSFALIALSDTDPAEIIARRTNRGASEAVVEQIRAEMGLDKPLYVRYWDWLRGFFTGDLGFSHYSFREVREDIAEYFPVTLSVTGLALLWIVAVSVPVALLCARYKDGVFDHLTRGVSMLGICLPTFWLGFLLLLAFAVRLRIFTVAPAPGIKGLILPSFALAVPVMFSFIRLFRSALLAQMSRDYVRYARARGLSEGRILLRHMTRNALPPIITMFCQYFGYLIAGGAVVESVFSLKGIGSHLIECVLAADAVTVATCVMIIAAIFVFSNLAGDVINRLLCPWMVRETNG